MSGTKYIYKTQHRISWTDLISIIGGFIQVLQPLLPDIYRINLGILMKEKKASLIKITILYEINHKCLS